MKLVLGMGGWEARIKLCPRHHTSCQSTAVGGTAVVCVHLKEARGLQMELVLLEEGKESRIPLSAKGGVKGI